LRSGAPHRRRLLQGLAAFGAAAAGRVFAATSALTEAQLEAGRTLLGRAPSVDLHSHAGRVFVEPSAGATALGASLGRPFAAEALRRIRERGLGAVCLAAVADYRVLEAGGGGLRPFRPFAPGEAYADYRRQLGLLKDAARDSRLAAAHTAADVARHWRAGRASLIFTVEGGDFIEDRLERVGEAAAEGVRSITIIHYRTNGIGDPQTAGPVHGGLSPFGRAVVTEMNRKGVVIDLSHASFDAVAQAAEVSIRPMILSHSNLKPPGVQHPRLVSLEQARLVARHGGVVAAMPGGAGVASLDEFATLVLRMVDQLGVDHVGVGSDMDFTFASVIPTYDAWSLIPSALLARGLSPAETLQVMGGNALRVLAANQTSRSRRTR
jgi:membrane dipeptidase